MFFFRFPFNFVPRNKFFITSLQFFHSFIKYGPNSTELPFVARFRQAVTRAEMAILLQNAYKFPTDSSVPMKYTDVSKGMVSYEAIQGLVQSGITKGFTETQFSPETLMTRATYSVFIARAERGELFE